MCAKSLQSCLTLCNSMDCSPPGSSVQGFSRQEHWSGLPCPLPGGLPEPGIELASLYVFLIPAVSTTVSEWPAGCYRSAPPQHLGWIWGVLLGPPRVRCVCVTMSKWHALFQDSWKQIKKNQNNNPS